MANRPWGPHGAEAPPLTTTPNPTAADPTPAFGQADEATAPIQGGGSGAGLIAVNIVISFFMLIMLWMPMACLYPLTSAAGAAAEFLSRPIFASAAIAQFFFDPAEFRHLVSGDRRSASSALERRACPAILASTAQAGSV